MYAVAQEPSAQPCLPPPALQAAPPASASTWRSKADKGPAENVTPLIATAAVHDEDLDGPEAELCRNSAGWQWRRAEGDATLAMLSDTRMAGCLFLASFPSDASRESLHPTAPMAPSAAQPSCAISGRAVTVYRDCTRDPEWSVVRLEIWGLPGRVRRPLCLLAERTGGDAMVLTAPVLWNEGEAPMQEVADLAAGCDKTAKLRFGCSSLLAEKAAQARVAEVMPALAGAAVVNEGHMLLQWQAKTG